MIFEHGIHPNLQKLSYNSQLTLHGCPRKFFLYRMLKKELSAGIERGDVHTDFGALVGYGVQRWLSRSIDEQELHQRDLYIQMLAKWQRDLEEENRQKKTFFHALHALDKFILLQQTELRNYELVWYDGKPATELGFYIDCGGGFSYRGFLDALLRHRETGKFAVWEGKTTSFARISEAMYKNSSQGLGYSVVVDAIANRLGVLDAEAYEIIYGVYKTTAMDWELFKFQKNFTQRALWIKSLLMDMQKITDYSEADYFPLHGETCYAYFRPCEYFEVCEMSDQYLVGDNVEVVEEDADKYEFKFNLGELIEAQLQKGNR